MFNHIRCMEGNKEKYIAIIDEWVSKKQVSLEKYELTKEELINFCGFCLVWLKRDIANEVICAVMHSVINDEIKFKTKK